MCAHALMGLLPDTVTVAAGEILFEGRDLLKLDDDGWRDLRGRRIAMVFQEPMTALNPLMRIGDQMTEMFEAHGLLTPQRSGARRRWRWRARSACPTPNASCAPIRTSSPAASASAP